MWIHVVKDSTAFNTDHISRFFVEETGSAAALKAEISGKIHMIAYVPSKTLGQDLLRRIVEAKRDGEATFTVTPP